MSRPRLWMLVALLWACDDSDTGATPEPPEDGGASADVALIGAVRDLGPIVDAALPDMRPIDMTPRVDDDGDGVADDRDNCPGVANPYQRDADQDGLGDACDVGDTDGDGFADRDDPCPGVAGPTDDQDRDGVGDICDVCPRDADPDQADGDHDGIGDVCEIPGDDDADGVPDERDSCPMIANGDQADGDMDGVGDVCDICPADPDPAQRDTDGDGLGDGCDVCPDVAQVAENHVDRDGDGQPVCAGDCDDANPDRAAGLVELCDGIDNDCDGMPDEDCVDDGCNPVAEQCNDADDDCDDRIDEGFDLMTDPAHCGACDQPCDGECRAGRCVIDMPLSCDRAEIADEIFEREIDISLDPRDNGNNYQGSCGGDGPEAVVVVHVDRPSNALFTTIFNAQRAVLYLRRECDLAGTELGCSNDGPLGTWLSFDRLEPGTYYLFVDFFFQVGSTTDVQIRLRDP